jgi:hypothetical protein
MSAWTLEILILAPSYPLRKWLGHRANANVSGKVETGYQRMGTSFLPIHVLRKGCVSTFVEGEERFVEIL